MDRGDLADVHLWAHRIGRDLGLRVTLIALDGMVIGGSDLDLRQLKHVESHINRPEGQEALHTSGLGLSKRYSYTIKN